MYCPYCGENRPDDEATAEHVIPQAIGGAVEPVNPFRLNGVCRRCNSASGHYVDGPFLRSWFLVNRRQLQAIQRIELTPQTILPLGYNGKLETPLIPGLDCDYWRGPTGDSVFHFHRPYPESTGPGVVGRPTNVRETDVDAGFVFLFVCATNPAWHMPIVNSVCEQFRGATLHLGNAPAGGPFRPIPEHLVPLRNQLRDMMRGTISAQIAIALDFGHRFLAKLALGCGALFLDPAFLRGDEARLLRNAMWERDPAARAALPIAGASFLNFSSSGIAPLLDWPWGHLLVMLPQRDSLYLCPVFYGHITATIRITSERRLWEGRISPEGTVYVIAPGLRRAVGPVDLATYVASRLFPEELVHADLAALFAAVEAVPQLPDMHLGDLAQIADQQRERVRQLVRERAYDLWDRRGRPLWDALVDWETAKHQLGVIDDDI